ncbi:hypothetical protein CY34DRAFT_199965 [Suillus luteus UH-Slu-Lm8-n1]|uniref:Uncharacterized protein n=1 Tax=Suillus luteus UH-Slu-Lm8-n1 TaxID=930992 RepID=A0A0D0BE17_9AGAM|nr:hypothetical protein CY34DRAFT_199965 [Suillus luteus UH-Slu-Lm8-n1]
MKRKQTFVKPCIVAPSSAIFNFHKFRGKYRLRSMVIMPVRGSKPAKPPKIDTDRCEAFTYTEPKPSCQGYLPLSAVVPRRPGRHYFVMRLNSNSCVYCTTVPQSGATIQKITRETS